MSTSQNITRLLKKHDLSPEGLAVAMQRAGAQVSVQSINRWISGKGNPNNDSLVALAKALGCTTDDILIGPELKAAS